MNVKLIAKLLRERAALDLELAEAFEEAEPKPKRKRATPPPTVQPSQEVIDQVRRTLRRKGIVT